MNKLFRVRIFIAVISFTLFSFSAWPAQYYVVIGAFAKEANARKFTGYARNLYLDAFYKFNAERNLYYVHVMRSSRKDEARNWTLFIQHATGFKDAWVFTDPDGEKSSFMQGDIIQRQTKPRYAPDQHLLLASSMAPVAYTKRSEKMATANYAETSKTAASQAAWTKIEEISYISGIKNAISFKENVPDATTGKLFTFLAETSDGKTIPAEVMLVNYEKARKLSSFRTGEYVAFRGNRKNQKLTIVCDVFGYSEEIRTFNLDNLKTARDIRQNSLIPTIKS